MSRPLEEVFGEVFKISASRVTDALSPDEVKGWNSFGHLALVSALEEAYGITFLDDDVAQMDSVGKVRSLLAQRLAAR